VATNAVRSPGSRLGDDLYRLYLMAMGWLFFPVYGDILAAILPTSDQTLQWAYPIAAVCVQVGWLWSGSRGGPMMVSRASILHELGAPVSPQRVLSPQLLRQAVAWGVGGAMVGGVFTSLSGDFAFSVAFPVSVAGFLLMFGAVMWAVVIMVGVRASTPMRTVYTGASLVAAITTAVTVLVTGTITDGFVLLALAVVAVTGTAAAWRALNDIPVRSTWRRAGNLESARSALLEVDFHRMMIDLRGAGDDKAVGQTRLPTGRWLSMWRCLAPIRHALPWSGLRISASLVAVILLAFAPIEQGVVLLAIGAVWLVLGYEISRGIAAVAGQVSFLAHYPRSSFRLLAGQLIASLIIGVLLIAIAYGWSFGIDQTNATVAAIIGAMGVVGGAVQARLGSPDTTAFVDKYGLSTAAGALWLRGAAAPVAMLVAIIVTFHGYSLQPLDLDLDLGVDIAAGARTVIPVLFAGLLIVCLQPIERTRQ